MAGSLDDNFENIKKRADLAGTEGFLDGILTAPDLGDLRLQAAKLKKKKDDDESESEDDDEERKKKGKKDKKAAGEENEEPEGEDPWFDETKIRKAERALSSKVNSVKAGLETQQKTMLGSLQEFAANRDWSMMFRTEIVTMDTRRKWLVAITAESDQPLKDLIDAETAKAKEEEARGKSDVLSSKY